MPQRQVALQFRPAQVEVPVPQAQLVIGGRLASGSPDRDGQTVTRNRAHDFTSGGSHFDVAGAEFGVALFRRPAVDEPLDEDDGFVRRGLRGIQHLRRRPSRTERHLHQAGAIPKIEKHQATEITTAMDPAAQAHRHPLMFGPEITAAMRAHRGCRHA